MPRDWRKGPTSSRSSTTTRATRSVVSCPTLTEETVAAIARSAYARGRIAVAHIGNERFARGAIAAGVDGLAHLFVGPGLLDIPPMPSKLSCAAAPQAVRQLSAAGVPALAGTDSPALGTTYAASLHRELEHLVDAGLTPTAALAAATTARAFRMSDRGRIRAGVQRQDL